MDSKELIDSQMDQNRHTEEWRAIPGYEGLYEVSSFGRVKRLERLTECKNGRSLRLPELIMSLFESKQGYIYLVLQTLDGRAKREAVHRLVGMAFVSGRDDSKNHIDHIDGDRTNNRADNIRWVTRIENMHNPITEAKIDMAIGRRVVRIAPDGSRKEYHQIKDVEADGFSRHKVCSCCTGNRKSHKGYKWEYAL